MRTLLCSLSFAIAISMFFGTAARAAQKKSCNRDSLQSVAALSKDIVDAIRVLPPAEQFARIKIRTAIGVCALKFPNIKAENLPTSQFTAPNKNLYDGMAFPFTKVAYQNILNMEPFVFVRADGAARPMTGDDFKAIDVLARTLFTEIRPDRCQGKRYMAAVARVILNRSLESNPAVFQPADKVVGIRGNSLVKVMLADKQFSVWNNDNEVGGAAALESHKKNTKKGLCPTGEPTTASEQQTWQNAIDLAMHAVLDQRAFMEETKQFGGIEYYTSGRSTWPGFVRVGIPKIYGVSLDDPSCMIFWKDGTH